MLIMMKRTFETSAFIDQNIIRFRGKIKIANAKQKMERQNKFRQI